MSRSKKATSKNHRKKSARGQAKTDKVVSRLQQPSHHRTNHPVLIVLAIVALVVGIMWLNTNNTNPSTLSTPSTTTTSTSASSTSTMSSTTIPAAPILAINPKSIIQGEPIMVSVLNETDLKNITGGSVNGSPLAFTMYQGTPIALYAIGINGKVGTSTVKVTLDNGTKTGLTLTKTFFVGPRARPTEALPIPDQIGGNSPANQVAVENSLAAENVEIDAVPSYMKGAFWTDAFAYPVDTASLDPRITDTYGFNRDSGEMTIPHMGADFKAASGTPVYAINNGIVRVTKFFTVYGGTVIVDHGLGVESLYMHMSSITATSGATVTKGQLLGYSGETGYAVGPHLHLSIKINGISIDPLKFFALFGLVDTNIADD